MHSWQAKGALQGLWSDISGLGLVQNRAGMGGGIHCGRRSIVRSCAEEAGWLADPIRLLVPCNNGKRREKSEGYIRQHRQLIQRTRYIE
jgi:hypothetical protein